VILPAQDALAGKVVPGRIVVSSWELEEVKTCSIRLPLIIAHVVLVSSVPVNEDRVALKS
jgi:hypothetical protein